jgi:hypothetical protein
LQDPLAYNIPFQHASGPVCQQQRLSIAAQYGAHKCALRDPVSLLQLAFGQVPYLDTSAGYQDPPAIRKIAEVGDSAPQACSPKALQGSIGEWIAQTVLPERWERAGQNSRGGEQNQQM